MSQLTVQELVKANYSGAIDNSWDYINLVIEASAVLFAGIVLWRTSVVFHNRKKAKRANGKRFETIYQKEWKR
jgi:hypothetical protein